MRQIFDTDTILFAVLKSSPVSTAINGGIYLGNDRPDDSHKEDIVINTVYLSQDALPQAGASNINIFVPDIELKIGGKPQKKSDRTRLKALSELTLSTLRDANIDGLKIWIERQDVFSEPSINQHFANIRVGWNILTE